MNKLSGEKGKRGTGIVRWSKRKRKKERGEQSLIDLEA